MNECIFCKREDLNIVLENESCLAFYDLNPVSKGHLLIIPKKHRHNYFDLSLKEKSHFDDLLNKGKIILDKRFNPDGYNIGMTAGQSIFHCHGHLIPRYDGDMKNPKGGVRGVIPDKMNY